MPGWLGDRCQVAPPQPIHHAKQRGKADLSLSLSFSLCLSLSVFVLLVCLFLVTSNNYFVITSVIVADHILAMFYVLECSVQSELGPQLG